MALYSVLIDLGHVMLYNIFPIFGIQENKAQFHFNIFVLLSFE